MVVAAACALGASLILAHFVRRRLVERFTRALDDMRRVLDGANAELSRERARLETLVECIPDALVIANLRGEVLFCNAAALPLFSASREDMMSGGKGLLQPRDPSRWRMRVQEVLKAHTSCGVMEMPAVAGGPPTSFRTTVSMLADPVMGDFGVLILLRDQTSESLIVSDQFQLLPAAVQPASVLRRTARLFQPMADEKGVRLETSLADGAPSSFEADERLVERVIHHLVANAIKFTPRGGLVLIEADAAGPDRLEFVVADTGPGIPEAHRAAVFEKPRRLDADPPTPGFGLALCARIIKLHQGEICVQPAKTGGAQFVVRLPLTRIAKEVTNT